MGEEDGLRTRSFRNEDYETRRVFLRSYPLQFDNNEDDHDTQVPRTTYDDNKDKHTKKKKEAMKKIMVTIVEWGGGRVVVLRRFKHKVSFRVVACFPIAFKPPKALVSSR